MAVADQLEAEVSLNADTEDEINEANPLNSESETTDHLSQQEEPGVISLSDCTNSFLISIWKFLIAQLDVAESMELEVSDREESQVLEFKRVFEL